MIEIGIDLVSIARFEKLIQQYDQKILQKFLTPQEIALSKNPQSIAGFWAAKEACSKALKCGIGRELSFFDIQIYKNQKGAPYLELSAPKQRYFGVRSISLSISHDHGFAIAAVIICLHAQ